MDHTCRCWMVKSHSELPWFCEVAFAYGIQSSPALFRMTGVAEARSKEFKIDRLEYEDHQDKTRCIPYIFKN